MVRENPVGRKSKFEGTIPAVFNVSIPEKFKDTYNKIVKLSEIDDNPGFLDYCTNMENVNLNALKMNKRSIYIRWVLTKHVFANLGKIL